MDDRNNLECYLIPLPESLRVNRNKAAERLLTDKAREWIEKNERAPGIHASSLLDPRQAYWQIKDPRPLPDRLVTMFLVGNVLHAFVLGAVDGAVDINASDEGSSYNKDLDIMFSPDRFRPLLEETEPMVRELKTSRSFYEPKDIEDLGHYLEQILIYMASTDTTKAQLWVLYLNLRGEDGRTSPAFRGYDICISPDDLEKTKAFLLATKSDLEKALATDDHTILDLCREFKCGAGNCEWYSQCKPEGRYGNPRWDGGPRVKRERKAKPKAKATKAKR